MRRVAAGLHHPVQLAGADDVKAGPGLGERGENREIAIGLHGVTNRVLHWPKRPVERGELADDVLPAVNVQGRPELLRQLPQWHLFAAQLAPLIVKVIHDGRQSSKSAPGRNHFRRQ